MRRFSTLVLLLGLCHPVFLGCSKQPSISEPMTEEQLAEQDKRVQEEEQLHFQQVQANAAAQPQRGAYGQ